MKKAVNIFSVLLFLFSVLCGCQNINSTPVSYGDTVEIPENGIISASVFEQLKTENKAATFYGVSNGIRYEWTVFGNAVSETKDINLGLEISKTEENIELRFLSKEDFGFRPVLSLYVGGIRKDGQYSAVDSSDTLKKETVTVTEKEETVLNFPPEKHTGSYLIVSEDIPENTDGNAEGNKDTEQTDNPQKENEEVSPKTDGTKISEKQQTAVPPKNTENKENAAEIPSERPVSDGKSEEQDIYRTDPVPEGRPLPQEPDETETDTRKTCICTFSIECTSILNNIRKLDESKLDVLPQNGIIYPQSEVTFYEGESVFDVLQRVCRENGIHLESSWTPMYNSSYIEGINNIYEFDCGDGSGWMYRVDGWYPNYGCSRYVLKDGETVEWRYTCDFGKDIGGGYFSESE